MHSGVCVLCFVFCGKVWLGSICFIGEVAFIYTNNTIELIILEKKLPLFSIRLVGYRSVFRLFGG